MKSVLSPHRCIASGHFQLFVLLFGLVSEFDPDLSTLLFAFSSVFMIHLEGRMPQVE